MLLLLWPICRIFATHTCLHTTWHICCCAFCGSLQPALCQCCCGCCCCCRCCSCCLCCILLQSQPASASWGSRPLHGRNLRSPVTTNLGVCVCVCARLRVHMPSQLYTGCCSARNTATELSMGWQNRQFLVYFVTWMADEHSSSNARSCQSLLAEWMKSGMPTRLVKPQNSPEAQQRPA